MIYETSTLTKNNVFNIAGMFANLHLKIFFILDTGFIQHEKKKIQDFSRTFSPIFQDQKFQIGSIFSLKRQVYNYA